MKAIQQTPDLRDDLTHFQGESLSTVALLAGGLGYAWFLWTVSPFSGASIPVSAWLGIGALVLSSGAAHFLKNRRLNVARYLLVVGILGATACAAVTFPFPVAVYLFILPIMSASVLLGKRGFLLVSVAVTLLVVTAGVMRIGVLTLLSAISVPLTVIMLVAVGAWLSLRNTWTALEWFRGEYNRAHRNRLVANERQAELRRALKSLDEATETLRRTNLLLTIARGQAEEARRLKQQFAQTVSHELRTPLNLIVGFTELMVQSPEHYGGQLPMAYARDLSIVYRNASHLQSLVNDVLDLARIEAAQMGLVPEETDPAVIVQEAVETARSLVEVNGLALHTQVEPDLPCVVVDPIRIRQVLFNLLSNAVKWTNQGSITVKVGRQEEMVVFAVADTGVGVAPEDRSRIFEEFRQLDMGTRRGQAGAGLGLAISKQFVELHGGSIWLESEVGKGSTFYFSLPAHQAGLEASLTDMSGSAALSERAARIDGDSQPVLLVVTRSLSATSLLNRYVHGCRTVTAPDFEKSRLLAQQLAPQLVIIDQTCAEMATLDPEELARAWGLPHSLFVTCALPGEESLRRQLAVEGYLIKPVTRQGLWDALRPFGESVDTVLVVDDDVDFVRMLNRMLDNPLRRYQVLSAYSGQEALSLMRHHTPDLILLDLFMPHLDGFQVIERIRSTEPWQHIPIIVVSAQDQADSEAVSCGAMSVARADGLMPGELVHWIQNMVDMAAQAGGASQSGNGQALATASPAQSRL